MKTKKRPPASSLFETLWREGFFETPKKLAEVSERLASQGYHFKGSSQLNIVLVRAIQKDGFLTRERVGKQWRYVQTHSPTGSKAKFTDADLFEKNFVKKLGRSFASEIADLSLNFGKNGNCTAFLLRKILEKLIYIVFTKRNMGAKLEDKTRTGRLVGLEAMIDITAKEKINGVPLLTSKTAKEIKGIKFLGDVAAHNPLVDVDMKTILPQMPFIITAYKELANHL